MKRLAILGNHLPRQCGIATFTTHLADALATALPDVDSFVLAMNDAGRRHALSASRSVRDRRGRPRLVPARGGFPERQSRRRAVRAARVRDLRRQGGRPRPRAPARAADADRDDASHRALGAQSGAARGDRRAGAALGAPRRHERLGRGLAHARPRHIRAIRSISFPTGFRTCRSMPRARTGWASRARP